MAREADDSVVELTWLRQHKETLIPRQFVSLPVHKPHDLKKVWLVVIVDHAELIRSVPHATLILALLVEAIVPFLDLPQKLDHLHVGAPFDINLSNGVVDCVVMPFSLLAAKATPFAYPFTSTVRS